MKKFSVFCVIFLSILNSFISGQLEGFDDEQEIQPTAGKFGYATISEHVTFMASLRLKAMDSPYGNGHVCGAVFITRKHLLSAAVCVIKINRDYTVDELEIVAGVRNRYENGGAHKFDVLRIYYRTEYQRFPVLGMDGNVVILEVRQMFLPLTMNHRAHVRPPPLRNSENFRKLYTFLSYQSLNELPKVVK